MPEPSTSSAERMRLSVWPSAQSTARAQRAGRYTASSTAHPGKMLPAIARGAIDAYTQPGDLIIDPMCGIGTTLVEAVEAGRDAIGVEVEAAWAAVAEKNLKLAADRGAIGHADVVVGDGRRVADLAGPRAAGRAALVITSPPYGASTHGQVHARPGRGVAKSHTAYGTDPANLANAALPALASAVTDILAGCAQLLRPGGIAVLTVRPIRRHGALIDLPAQVAAAGEAAGLILFERNVALLAALRDDTLIPRASFFALDKARRANAAGITQHVIAHEDVLVFRRPT